ncbi:MAG: hypothetical protein KGJ78_14040 [Alphaproteobacteria bacterium]|nr:hypothetical protein [Alphaproteobacteria bacterium]
MLAHFARLYFRIRTAIVGSLGLLVLFLALANGFEAFCKKGAFDGMAVYFAIFPVAAPAITIVEFVQRLSRGDYRRSE